jgi:hypothetical protein
MKSKYFLLLIVSTLLFPSCSKTDVASDQLNSFIKFFGMGKINKGNDVLQLDDGNYLVFGTCTTPDSGTDMYLARTDEYGNKIWEKNIGIKNDEEGYKMKLDDDGNLFLLGTRKKINSSITNIVYIVTNTDADTIATHVISSDTSMIGNDIQLSSAGGLLIAGSATYETGTYSLFINIEDYDNPEVDPVLIGMPGYVEELKQMVETNDGYLFIGSDNNNSSSTTNIYILRTNYEGLYLANIDTGSTTAADMGQRIKKLSDGSFLGLTTLNAGGNTGKVICLYKFNLVGTDAFHTIWFKTFGDASNANYEAKDIEIVSDNEYAITGIDNSGATQDIMFFRTDNAGNMIGDIKKYIGTGNQTSNRIIKSSEGGFVIVGTNDNSDYSVITLIKVKSDGSL